MSDSNVLLKAEKISKNFHAIEALKDVDFILKENTITALIGENGAGKSTLVKILSGYHSQDSGRIELDNETVQLNSVNHAQSLGISVIHQIPAFASDLSVVDNIFLGREISRSTLKSSLSRFDRKKQTEKILPVINQYDPTINPDMIMKNLKAYQQRLVGIIKALVFSARILIMDEPTAALPLEEREILLNKILQLKEQGYSVIYVSHHMDEIVKVADEVVALRDGRPSGYTERVPNQTEMIEMMTGNQLHHISELYDGELKRKSPVKIKPASDSNTIHSFHITPPEGPENKSLVRKTVDLRFSSGELVILSGIVGSGVKDLAEAMYGARTGWTVYYSQNGKNKKLSSPNEAVKAGIGYLSDDRIKESMIPDFNIRQNMTIPMLKKVSAFAGSILEKKEKETVEILTSRLNVKMDSIEQIITSLSGGNQQKVMIGRWLFSEVSLLILNEPTQGIDVIAKRDVVGLLQEYISRGGTCVVATNDPEEFLHVADRAIVMRKGVIVRHFSSNEISREEILKTMLIHGTEAE